MAKGRLVVEIVAVDLVVGLLRFTCAEYWSALDNDDAGEEAVRG
jgi:hypothetical protein